nr:MAG TPA: hypothetical protein [Caudoviricetes sp.]
MSSCQDNLAKIKIYNLYCVLKYKKLYDLRIFCV